MSANQLFTWTSLSRTDVGRRRKVNEDACIDRGDIGLWVVADGMGGHSAGDVASGMIVETMAEVGALSSLKELVDESESRLLAVNTRLREIAMTHKSGTVGSTVAVLMIHGTHCVCMWAGDSRIYRFRDGALEKIMQDHTHVEELVARGVLTAEQAAVHPDANLITRAVGAQDELFLDLEIDTLQDGDLFVVCSDGLDKEVTEDEIAQAAANGNDENLASTLVELALKAGARDNVTVITVTVEAQGSDDDITVPPSGRRGLDGEHTVPRNDGGNTNAQ